MNMKKNLNLDSNLEVNKKIKKNPIKKRKKGSGRLIKWTKEACLEFALKCKSRTEFQQLFPNPYNGARHGGFLDEICSHMKPSRKYNEYWKNKQKHIGYWTKEKIQDVALNFSSKKEFNTAYPYLVKRLLLKGWYDEVCSHFNDKYTEEDKFSKEMCQDEALKYKNREDFRIGSPYAYRKAKRMEWLTDICRFMRYSVWTKELCLEEALKYKTRKEFKKHSFPAYNNAYRFGWLDEICKHMIKIYKPVEKMLNHTENDKITDLYIMKTILFNPNFVEITRKDLINQISLLSGHSTDSVSGTLFPYDKCFQKSWFVDNFIYDKKTKTIKLNNLNVSEEVLTYESDEKKECRKFICDVTKIAETKKPKILTFPSKRGLDVKYMLELNKYSNIYTLEKDKLFYNEYLKNNFNTANFNMKFIDFLNLYPTEKFHLINLDCYFYLADIMHKSLVIVNENKMCQYIAITFQNNEKLRNTSKWKSEIMKKYNTVKDVTYAITSDTLYNYTFVSKIVYRQKGYKLPMQVLIFKLK